MNSTDTVAGFRQRPCVHRARRLRFHAMLLIFMLLSFGLSACSDGTAQQLFDNAQFEERQNNYAHARELYQEIIGKYPNSEYARKAEERLRDVGQKK
jgi:hypothetical protein